jgi:flagellar motor switch protein FliM
VALGIVRELVSIVAGTRSQNITFEKIIEHEADTEFEVLQEAGFLATWQLVLGEARHAIAVHLPSTEFHRLVVESDEDVNMAPVEADASAWSDRMQSSLAATEVQLQAVMNRPDMPLEQLSQLRIGDVVELTDPQSTSAMLECEGEALFAGEIGQKDGFFAVHVRGEIHRAGSV